MADGQPEEGADRDAAVSAFWADLQARLKDPVFRKAFMAVLEQILEERSRQWTKS